MIEINPLPSELEFIDFDGATSETRRHVVADGVEWTAEVHFEKIDDDKVICWFHLHVWRMSTSNLKAMLRAWSDYRSILPQIIYTMADEDTEALDRLRERFGFRFIGTVPCSDGVERRAYVHFK